jgi:hypothetical protein
MKLGLAVFLLFAVAGWPGVARGQHSGASASLRVTTDLECDWKLDGASRGRLKAGDPKVVRTSLGKHLIQAVTTDGQDEWRKVINVPPGGQEVVEIELKAVRQGRLAVWTDPSTGLMWTKRESGSDVTCQEARDYCTSLNTNRYAGYTGWRLPEIGELESVHDPSSSKEYKVKEPLQVSHEAAWSATLDVRAPGEALLFNFRLGVRYFPLLSASSYTSRALCVRRSGE